MRTNQEHILAGKKGANDCVLDLAMLSDGAHFEIVGDNQMSVSELVAQEFGHDVEVKRCRLEQSAGGGRLNVDVRKTAVGDHHAANAILSALKQLDGWRQVL